MLVNLVVPLGDLEVALGGPGALVQRANKGLQVGLGQRVLQVAVDAVHHDPRRVVRALGLRLLAGEVVKVVALGALIWHYYCSISAP